MEFQKKFRTVEIPSSSNFLKMEEGKLVVRVDKLNEFIDTFQEVSKHNDEAMRNLRNSLKAKRDEIASAYRTLCEEKEKEERHKMVKRKTNHDSQVALGLSGVGVGVACGEVSHRKYDIVPGAMIEDRNPTGCPEDELSQSEDDELDENGKPPRPGFARCHWRGIINMPVVTMLKRNKYGLFYSVSFVIRNKKPKPTVRRRYNNKYLRRSFTKTFFLGRCEQYFDWMWKHQELLKNPRDRYLLIEHFVRILNCRPYRSLSCCLNDEMSGLSFNGRGHSYIEANSRSHIATDGYCKGKGKKVRRIYLSQYLRRSDNKVDFRDPSIGGPEYCAEAMPELIAKYGLEKQFSIRRDELYQVIYPHNGDWNYKKDYVMVTKSYREDERCRDQVNIACANIHSLALRWISDRDKSPEHKEAAERAERKMLKFGGLYLCDPVGRRAIKPIGFEPSHYDENGNPQFRSFDDYEPTLLKDETRDITCGKDKGRADLFSQKPPMETLLLE